MDISDFYSLSSKWVTRTFTAYAQHSAKGKFDELSRSEYDGIDFPVVFRHESGNRLDDILDTGTVSLFLISEKLRIVLTQAGLTGWQTFEIKLITKKGVEIPGYHGLSILGRCGPVDYSKGAIIEKPPPVPNGLASKYRKGFYIGLDKWDGSDFSRPDGNLTIILTKKAADVIRNNKITNAVLTNLSDKEISFTVSDIVLSSRTTT